MDTHIFFFNIISFEHVTLAMRLEKLENLLELASEMQAKRYGISIQDIMEKFRVSRRTAIRMKDIIKNVFPFVTEVKTESRVKRWTIPTSTLDKISNISTEEFTALDISKKILLKNNLDFEARKIESLQNKLSMILSSNLLNKIETDLEVLVENELIAFKAGPKPIYEKQLLKDIRYAVKACLKCEIKYNKKKFIVEPYGILFGHRHYLVARNSQDKIIKLKYYSLPEIELFKISNGYFSRNDSLSIKKLVDKSFGVFDEKPFDVEIVFNKNVAKEARQFLFHSSQTFTDNPNKTLTLKFHSGGMIEMAWYFFRWGNNIEILKPKKLKILLKKFLINWKIVP